MKSLGRQLHPLKESVNWFLQAAAAAEITARQHEIMMESKRFQYDGMDGYVWTGTEAEFTEWMARNSSLLLIEAPKRIVQS